MKKAVIFVALLFFLTFDVHAAEKIKTACELAEIQPHGEYTLAANIFIENWTPIENFCGSFDGAGFFISGLDAALFAKTENAEIRNVVIIAKSMRNRPDGAAPENAELAFSGDFAATGGTDFELFRFKDATLRARCEINVGILVNEAFDCAFENIRIVGGEVSSDTYVRTAGGFAGFLQNCTAENVLVSNVKISANALASGGFAGQISGGKFSSCAAEFICISGGETIGGFVGDVTGDAAHKGAEFARCRAAGNVQNGSLAGGFVGRLADSRVTNSHAHALVLLHDAHAGGFVGEITNASRIEFSSATGSVFADTAAGFVAIISDADAPNTITESLALCTVIAGNNARRFAAIAHHDGINNCYAYLGTVVIVNGLIANVTPNPYGNDGGDFVPTPSRTAPTSHS